MTSQISARLLPGYPELLKKAVSPSVSSSSKKTATTTTSLPAFPATTQGHPPTSISLLHQSHHTKRRCSSSQSNGSKRAKIAERNYDAKFAKDVLRQAGMAIPQVQLNRTGIDYSNVTLMTSAEFDAMSSSKSSSAAPFAQFEASFLHRVSNEYRNVPFGSSAAIVSSDTSGEDDTSSPESSTSSVTSASSGSSDEDEDESEDASPSLSCTGEQSSSSSEPSNIDTKARILVVSEFPHEVIHINDKLEAQTGLSRVRVQGHPIKDILENPSKLVAALKGRGKVSTVLHGQSIRTRSERLKWLAPCSISVSSVGTGKKVSHYALEILEEGDQTAATNDMEEKAGKAPVALPFLAVA